MKLFIAVALLAVASTKGNPLDIPKDEMEALVNLGFDAFKYADSATTYAAFKYADSATTYATTHGPKRMVPQRTGESTIQSASSTAKIDDYENIEISAPQFGDVEPVKFVEVAANGEDIKLSSIRVTEPDVSSSPRNAFKTDSDFEFTPEYTSVKTDKTINFDDVISPINTESTSTLGESTNDFVITLNEEAHTSPYVEFTNEITTVHKQTVKSTHITTAASNKELLLPIIKTDDDVEVKFVESSQDDDGTTKAESTFEVSQGDKSYDEIFSAATVGLSFDNTIKEKTFGPATIVPDHIPSIDKVKVIEEPDNRIDHEPIKFSAHKEMEKVLIIDSAPGYVFFPSKKYPNPWVR